MRQFGRISQPIPEQELVTLSWAQIKGAGTTALWGSENVSSLTDNGGGDYTVTWAVPFATASSYAVVIGSSGQTNATTRHFQAEQAVTAASVRTSFLDFNVASATDPDMAYVVALGEF